MVLTIGNLCGSRRVAHRRRCCWGEEDKVVLVGHARKLAATLEALGVAVTLQTYEGRGHRDTVAALAGASPNKLPVIEEIRRFVK